MGNNQKDMDAHHLQIVHYAGRPTDADGHTAPELATYDWLDRLQVPYDTYCHPAVFTMEECEAVKSAIGAHVFKNLFLCNRQKTQFYLLLLPAGKPFKTKHLSAQLGCARLSFADAEAMEQLLHIHPGAVSPMGLMNDRENRVRLVVDRDLLEEERVGCHPCVNTATLRLALRDLLEVFAPSVGHPCTLVQLPVEEQE